jgi:hypothetical protein
VKATGFDAPPPSGQYDYRMLIENWRKWCRLNDATAVPAAASSRGARKVTAA